MFRIETFVEDKNLARVMHLLTGLVIDIKVQPVANGVAKNGKMTSETDTGTMLELFAKWLKGRAGFNAKQIKEFCIQNGKAESYYAYLLKQAKEAKLIRNKGTGTATTYHPTGGAK